MSLKIGFIGVGGIAQAHLLNVSQSDGAIVTAVCDIDETVVNTVAKKYEATAYVNYIQMLEQEQLDAVFVCVPPFAHADIEELAANKNLAVFIEKPLGLEMTSVERKWEAIRGAGIVNGTGYCLRYWDIVQQAKDYLAGKQIAMIVGYYATRFVQTSWWREMNKSGGQLVEQTTHIVDLMRYLSGGEIEAVQAFMNLVAMEEVEGLDIPDVGTVNFKFSTGAVGHVHTTFLQPDHRSGVEILGPDYRLTIDASTLTIVEKDQTIIRRSANNFYETQDLDFLEAVRTGDRTRVLAPYNDAMRTLEVTLAANKSSKTGQVINLAR